MKMIRLWILPCDRLFYPVCRYTAAFSVNYIKHKQTPYYKIDFYFPVSGSKQVSIPSSRLSGDTRKSLRHFTHAITQTAPNHGNKAW